MSRPANLRHTRLGRRQADIRLVQEASAFITELGEALDRQLLREDRPAERLRMLRETTNRITRTANDAIRAYGRVRSALTVENELTEGDRAGALEMQQVLSEARAEVLAVLDTMNRRYAWGYAREDAGETPSAGAALIDSADDSDPEDEDDEADDEDGPAPSADPSENADMSRRGAARGT